MRRELETMIGTKLYRNLISDLGAGKAGLYLLVADYPHKFLLVQYSNTCILSTESQLKEKAGSLRATFLWSGEKQKEISFC